MSPYFEHVVLLMVKLRFGHFGDSFQCVYLPAYLPTYLQEYDDHPVY